MLTKEQWLRRIGLTTQDAEAILDYSTCNSAFKDIVGTHVSAEKAQGVREFLDAMRQIVAGNLIP